MKESGMDKLIELLDEYRKQNPREFFGDDGSLVVLTGKDFIELNRLIIISKEYEFIKRLVENNKIDFDKIKGKILLERELYDRILYWYEETDFLIMILSIQDNPIEFLCEILK